MAEAISGVPQGFIIGSILFVICIEEAACWQVVGQDIVVDDKKYREYDIAIWDMVPLTLFWKIFVGWENIRLSLMCVGDGGYCIAVSRPHRSSWWVGEANVGSSCESPWSMDDFVRRSLISVELSMGKGEYMDSDACAT